MRGFWTNYKFGGIPNHRKHNTGNSGNSENRPNFQAVLNFPEFPAISIRS